MGLGFKEVIEVTKKGYTPGDIVELNNIIKEGKHNQDDILSLALNGMKIDDVKNTLLIIEENGSSDSSGQSSQGDQKPNDNKGTEGQETAGDSPDNGADDGIDYKKKYEEEKALREKLQNDNARKGASSEGGAGQKKETDYDIALKFAESVLN